MTTQKLATVAAILVALTLAQTGRSQPQTVYNNSTTDLTTRFNPGTNEIGDEIFLGGSARLAATFSFEYYGINFSGNEMARVRFYLNDGAFPGIAEAPGTMFFDSGAFSFTAPPTNAPFASRGTLNFDLTGQNLLLPNHFTWTVSFSGVSSALGESAGLSIYDPPTVGNNVDDAWLRAGNGAWGLITNNNPAVPLTFGARFTAVPEPAVWTLSIIGGLFGLVLLRRRKS